MERLRLRKARGREARRKEKAGRFLTHCNAMKKHAANKVQRRKRREAANHFRGGMRRRRSVLLLYLGGAVHKRVACIGRI